MPLMGAPEPAKNGDDSNVSVRAPAVFISYASQDVEAAKRICDALRGSGIEVWFDQSELRGGDAWDRKIRQQIRDCALFVPIISGHTQERPEGYFRLEWKLAVDRSHLMAAEKAFLVPVVIDATKEPEALVPTQFREVQWTRIQAGEVPTGFVARIAVLLKQPVASHVGGADREVSRAPARHAHIVLTTLSAALVVGLMIAMAIRGGALWRKSVPKVETSTASAPVAITQAAVSDKSVAVLPFVDMSEKKDQEYFSDGMAEEIIDLLVKIPDLRVPARTSSFYFKGKSTKIPEIARELGVAHVLEGSVRRSGNHLRVTAQLVRADNGYHVWSETYDRTLDDVFKVQDEVASAVVKALKVSLLEGASTRTAPTTNSEAYALYMQASTLLRRGNPTDAAMAADDLQRAIQFDPTFAAAFARLAQTRTFQYEIKALPYEQALVEARHAAKQALALDPTLAAAHLSMARVDYFEGNWRAAEGEIQRARQLDPRDADAARWGAIILLTLGRASEAVSAIKQAVELDPLDAPNYAILADTSSAVGKFEEAELALRKAIELAPPAGFGAREAFPETLLAMGHPAAALALSEQLDDREVRDRNKALAYFALRRKAESDAALADLKGRFAESDAYDIASVHAYRGEKDEAFRWLDRAYQRNSTELRSVQYDWLLTNLRSDPRYKEFLRKMKFSE
jgi:TolB-like protein/tetratricopeptide (TPR) repeat protein